MNQQFILFRRAGVFYCEDTRTGKQTSLRTKDRAEAQTLLHARNEATRQPHLNRQIARAYWMGTDALATARTWQHVMDEMIRLKTGANRDRWRVAANSKAFDPLRRLLLIETQAEHLLRVLEGCKVSTNVFLRRLHNFALDMNWLPCSIIPRRQWPPVRFREKRAITLEEHQRILTAERNPERRAFYDVCWHLGGSQGDLARLRAEDIDWENRTVSFFRRKTGSVTLQHMGPESMRLLADLPGEGLLFPYLAGVRTNDRSTEFYQRCKQLGITGVSLHSYRYAWAERAKSAGYPERFAQEALGHNSKAVHRAYARRALVKLPSLEEYEARAASATT
ncbi:MAG: tyrosine-type recombinase/integrase [Limisphaerales bacterium]